MYIMHLFFEVVVFIKYMTGGIFVKAQLILENGKRFSGEMFGSQKNIAGEVIFVSGGVIGYQEIINDPAYAGQIVIMTFPLIGNYGINLEQENDIPSYLSAMIVRDKCDEPSNFRCEMTFEEYLEKKDVVGLYGIDTRSLTKIIRDNGVMKGVIVMGEPDENEVQKMMAQIENTDVCMKTTTKQEYTINDGGEKNVAVIDLGSKDLIVDELVKKNCKVTVYPVNTEAEKILAGGYDLLVVSDGPGNPLDVPENAVKDILGKIPVIGIGMGHQVIGLAMGGEIEKLKFGHHGGSQPVKNVVDGDVFITSQNHNYIVKNLPENICKFINVNDGTCEGIYDEKMMVQSVQFQPEAAPGTLNIGFLFERILGEVK